MSDVTRYLDERDAAALEAVAVELTLPARIRHAIDSDDASSIVDIRAVGSLDRQLVTINAALLRSIVRDVRRRPHADIRHALLVLVAALSRNRYWRSTVSVPRLARLLARSDRTIMRHIGALADDGLIQRSRRAGASDAIGLVYQTIDMNRDMDPLAVLDAIAPASARRAVDRGEDAQTANPGQIVSGATDPGRWRQVADDAGLSEEQSRFAYQKFSAHWLAGDTPRREKTEWLGEWRKWCAREREMAPRGALSMHNGGLPESDSEKWRRIAAELVPGIRSH